MWNQNYMMHIYLALLEDISIVMVGKPPHWLLGEWDRPNIWVEVHTSLRGSLSRSHHGMWVSGKLGGGLEPYDKNTGRPHGFWFGWTPWTEVGFGQKGSRGDKKSTRSFFGWTEFGVKGSRGAPNVETLHKRHPCFVLGNRMDDEELCGWMGWRFSSIWFIQMGRRSGVPILSCSWIQFRSH
jgi:hypothetical protein